MKNAAHDSRLHPGLEENYFSAKKGIIGTTGEIGMGFWVRR